MTDETRPKIYEVVQVVLDHSTNSAGGVDVTEGTLYKFVDNNEEAGILAHSVGPLGESTGIFSSMEGTAPQEVAEIVDAPKDANMEIPQEYKENEETYIEALKEMEERQNERWSEKIR